MSEDEAVATGATEADAGDDAADTDHLDDLQAGAGCTEIWEHLSEHRERAGSD